MEKIVPDVVTGNIVNGVVYGKAKRWWGPVPNEDKKPEQVEFDIMAESQDKKYLLVGECKWTTQENVKQLTAKLLRKANLLLFAKNHIIVPMLFLKNATKDDDNTTCRWMFFRKVIFLLYSFSGFFLWRPAHYPSGQSVG